MIKNFAKSLKWIPFKGQSLQTGDILITNHGLAFVDSGYTTGEPSRITSIPEDWSFSFENGDINKRVRDDGSAFISEKGYYYTEIYNGKSHSGGKILFICRLIKQT